MLDEPLADDMRGKVFSYGTGTAVSLDRDLGAGWKHIAAVRTNHEMELFVDGRLVAKTEGSGTPLDVSNNVPLRIGFGPQSHFDGKIRDVRLYNRALTMGEVATFQRPAPLRNETGD
jgi:hypothetical protein